MSTTTTLGTHTGSWKYIQPLYRDRVAPCNQGCPVGIDIEGYMNLLREGRIAEARELLLAENPMPSVTGRVCHHPCESACNRKSFDEAVSIHAVERMLGDLDLREPAPVMPTGDQRVAVVGSGPAGLACAWHLARFGYRVTVFEAAKQAGGMLRLGIPSYRLPDAVLDRDIDRIRAAGVEIRCDVRVDSEASWARLTSEYDAVFVATGAHRSRALGVPGEQLPGVRPGLDFLRQLNAGRRPDVGNEVVVVGGGNTAMDCARSAIRLGARVTVLYRRTRAEMPAIEDEVEDAEREGVRFAFLAAPVAFQAGDGAGCSVECQVMELGPPDASGRRRPIATNERFTLPADTVLTAIGEEIELAAIPPGVRHDALALSVDALGGTSRAAVFAGGDVTNAPRTVADALGAGKRAAIGIDGFLRGGQAADGNGVSIEVLRFAGGNVSAVRWLGRDPIRRVEPANEVVPVDDLNFNHFRRAPRAPDLRRRDGGLHGHFEEVNPGLTDAQAIEEALRCLNCGVCNSCDLCLILCPDVAISHDADGRYAISLEHCKGCGVCAAECPRGAIAMTREGL